MHTQNAISLLIVALGAFSIPLLSRRIGIPAAVGEILFGILVGAYGLGWFETDQTITFLAEFGFAFLMFLAGLELEFGQIERQGVAGVLTAVLVAVLFFLVAAGITLALDLEPVLFLVFGAASVGILLATLTELGLTRSRAGQAMILVGSIGEFLTIVLLTGVDLYYRFGLGWHLAVDVAKLGIILAAAYLILVLLRTLIWWWPRHFSRLVSGRDPSEIGVRAAMATMLAFIALATWMGMEAILGSFIAGAIFAFVFREKEVLQHKMSSIGFGFFVPIFFIWVGAEFNLDAVMRVDILPLLGIFLAASLVTKLLASLPLMAQKLSFREVTASALLLSAPLTLLVVIAQIGLVDQAFDERTAGAVVLLAIVTGTVLPWLFRVVLRPGSP